MSDYKSELFNSKYSNNFQPSWLDAFVMKYEMHRSEAMSKLMINRPEILLDLACGDGIFIRKYGQKYKKCIGFDISTNRIKLAIKKNDIKEAVYKAQDLDKGIPLPNESVSTVVCEASLAYFRNTTGFLSEVYRVLKPNGEFVVQIGNYAYLPRRISLLIGKLPKVSAFSGDDDGGMIRYFTYASLKHQLELVEFTITHTSNSGLLAKWRRIMPSVLAPDIIYRAVKK